MYSMIHSSAIVGMKSFHVRVEVDVSNGLPGFEIVGMAGGEVKEAKERVKVALKNIGIMLPPKKITVNLSPANIRKNGTAFDLPLAIGILTSMEILLPEVVENILFLGELGLNAEIKFVNGVMPSAIMAKEQGLKCCIVPKVNAAEGSVIEGIGVEGFEHLSELLEYLTDGVNASNRQYNGKINPGRILSESNTFREDFADIYGQEGMKRVAEIAAAGFHHFMMIGPPGAGKSMLAKRIPTIMPPLSVKESLEISQIYSIKGLLSEETPLITKRPFLSPHHTVTMQAMTGGGAIIRPGIISMAHRGVLFLDEAPHFSKEVIEVLRQPLEDKKVEVSRVGGTFIFPADFMLVLACNPCPCGFYPDRNRCRCTEYEIKRYRAHLSGPILDRIDLSATVNKISIEELKGQGKKPISSAEIRERIEIAGRMQKERFAGLDISFNSEMESTQVKELCNLDKEASALSEKAYAKLSLTARAYHKILKVARTIADLDESRQVKKEHVAEAIGYRVPEE